MKAVPSEVLYLSQICSTLLNKPMPLVLVQNPVIVNAAYDWKDIESVQYHFPNQYKNRFVLGTPFDYRGTRRRDGKRWSPEYFGDRASRAAATGAALVTMSARNGGKARFNRYRLG